jgi:transposase-like protein
MLTSASSEKRETRPRRRSLIRGWVTPQRLAASACVHSCFFSSAAIFCIRSARALRFAASSGVSAIASQKFSGEVEADETFVGGKLANMHRHRQEKLRALGRSRGGVFGKAIVTGLLDRNAKKARVKVMGNVRQFGIRTNVIENVEAGSTVYSDALKSYRNLGADGFVHEFINHTETYVKGRIHTNGLENFWSLFTRAPKGTYVSVEPFHLQAYADEQAFRYNNRKMTDGERFSIAVDGIVGKRITFDQLTGKAEE